MSTEDEIFIGFMINAPFVASKMENGNIGDSITFRLPPRYYIDGECIVTEIDNRRLIDKP